MPFNCSARSSILGQKQCSSSFIVHCCLSLANMGRVIWACYVGRFTHFLGESFRPRASVVSASLFTIFSYKKAIVVTLVVRFLVPVLLRSSFNFICKFHILTTTCQKAFILDHSYPGWFTFIPWHCTPGSMPGGGTRGQYLKLWSHFIYASF